LKLNGTHQLIVYADDANILVGSICTKKKNTDVLVVASKETGLEVIVDKTKYMVMSQNETVGQSHNIRIDNKSFERVEQLKYFGTTLMYQNSTQEEINCRFKLGRYLPSFDANNFVFPFAIQKCKD